MTALSRMRQSDLLALFNAALDELHRRSRRGRPTCYSAVVPRCLGSAVGGICTCWAGVPYETRAEVAERSRRRR